MTAINFPITSSAFISVGNCPVQLEATNVACKVVVADSQPSIGTSGLVLNPSTTSEVFVPVDASSQAWVASLGADSVVAALVLTGPLGSGGGGGGVLQSVTVLVPSGQLLNMVASPVTIVPAPGANKVVVVTDSFFEYKRGTTSYVSPGNGEGLYYLNDQVANGGTAFPLDDAYAVVALTSGTSGLVANAMSASDNLSARWAFAVGAGLNGPKVSPVNQPVVLASVVSALTSGDGSLYVTVNYFVVTTH